MTLQHALTAKLKTLNETVWELRARQPAIDAWLDNFSTPLPSASPSDQRLHALYLLSQFMYFGSRQMRELMKVLYRDVYRYPVIETIRRAHGDTCDGAFLQQKAQERLRATRFLGMGNPSESGSHLLYYFRQENRLPKNLFIHTHEIFVRRGSSVPVIRDPDVQMYVFIDDFCGSGDQALTYSRDLVEDLKTLAPHAFCAYYVVFATRSGIDAIRTYAQFDSVDSIYELDESFRCFSTGSRYFDEPPPEINPKVAAELCSHYGSLLEPPDPFGYSNGQLLIGFHHNTPDNTLPIIWHDGTDASAWTPIFRRYPKNYGW